MKEFVEQERAAISKEFLDKEIPDLLEKNKIGDLLFTATEYLQLKTKKKETPAPVSFVVSSNLFFLRDLISSTENLTFGADPEFILHDRKDKDRIVLFSSKHAVPGRSANGIYSMSELAVGADYGLLEIRPSYKETPKALAGNVKSLIKAFNDEQKEVEERIKFYEDLPDDDRPENTNQLEAISILPTEAVNFAHKKQRLLEIMENGELDFGVGVMGKFNQVSATAGSVDIGLATAELFGVSISAYDEPVFTQGNDEVLTAGGHLHFGGRRIRMMNILQLKELVKRFDKMLLPMAAKVETKAADLRRQHYGAPGEFRLKEYGIEYRSLSNAIFWPGNEKVLEEVLKKAEEIILTLHKEAA
jgi:hypothetical protein